MGWGLASTNEFKPLKLEVIEHFFQNEVADREASRCCVAGKNKAFLGSEPCPSPVDMTGKP